MEPPVTDLFADFPVPDDGYTPELPAHPDLLLKRSILSLRNSGPQNSSCRAQVQKMRKPIHRAHPRHLDGSKVYAEAVFQCRDKAVDTAPSCSAPGSTNSYNSANDRATS